MRITHQQATASVLSSLNRKSELIQTAQRMVSTGKRISMPSDDPQTMADILDARQILSTLEQYQRNIDKAELHTEALATTLETVNDFIERAQGIAAGAGQSPDLHAVLATDVALVREQLIQLANQQLGDVYLFAGHQGDTAPFLNDGSYIGDQGAYRVSIGPSAELSLKVDGTTIFIDTEDIFSILENLQTALENGDSGQIDVQAAALDRFHGHQPICRCP